MAETGFQTQQPGADARRAASEAASKGAEVVRHAADQAKDIGAKAGEQLKSGAQQQSAQMGGALHTLASKLEETSGQVDSKWVGSIVGQAANSLHSAASYFETSRPEALFSDFTNFARRNPAVVMGAAVAIGFVLARAGRVAASEFSSSGDQQSAGGDYGAGYSAGYAPPTGTDTSYSGQSGLGGSTGGLGYGSSGSTGSEGLTTGGMGGATGSTGSYGGSGYGSDDSLSTDPQTREETDVGR
jgi:hypothetical protein